MSKIKGVCSGNVALKKYKSFFFFLKRQNLGQEEVPQEIIISFVS